MADGRSRMHRRDTSAHGKGRAVEGGEHDTTGSGEREVDKSWEESMQSAQERTERAEGGINGPSVASETIRQQKVMRGVPGAHGGDVPRSVPGLMLGVGGLGAVAEEVVEPWVHEGTDEDGEPFATWFEGARARRAAREERVKELRRLEKEGRPRYPDSILGLSERMGMEESMVELAFVMEDVMIPGTAFGEKEEVRVLPRLLRRWMEEGSFEHEDEGEQAVKVDMDTLRVVAMEAVAAPRPPVRPEPALIKDPGWQHPEGKVEFPIEDLIRSGEKAREVRSTWLSRAAKDDHHYAQNPGRMCTPKAGWLIVTKDDLEDHVLNGSDDPETWPHFDISDPDRCKVRDVSDKKVGKLNTDYLRAILGKDLVDEESLFLADYGWRVNSTRRAYCLTAHGIAKTGTPHYEVRRGNYSCVCTCVYTWCARCVRANTRAYVGPRVRVFI